MIATGRNRVVWTTACRSFYEHHGMSKKRIFSSISNSYVFHHGGSSGTGTVSSQNDQQLCWDPRSAVVYPNVISEDEEMKLVSILTTKFQR